jgi:hypothetical protein
MEGWNLQHATVPAKSASTMLGRPQSASSFAEPNLSSSEQPEQREAKWSFCECLRLSIAGPYRKSTRRSSLIAISL